MIDSPSGWKPACKGSLIRMKNCLTGTEEALTGKRKQTLHLAVNQSSPILLISEVHKLQNEVDSLRLASAAFKSWKILHAEYF